MSHLKTYLGLLYLASLQSNYFLETQLWRNQSFKLSTELMDRQQKLYQLNLNINNIYSNLFSFVGQASSLHRQDAHATLTNYL